MARSTVAIVTSVFLALMQIAGGRLGIANAAAPQRNPDILSCATWAGDPNCYLSTQELCDKAWNFHKQRLESRRHFYPQLGGNTAADKLLARIDESRRASYSLLCRAGMGAVRRQCDALTGLDLGPSRGPVVNWYLMDGVRAFGMCETVYTYDYYDTISRDEFARAAMRVRIDYISANGVAGLYTPKAIPESAFREISDSDAFAFPYGATMRCLLEPGSSERIGWCEMSWRQYHHPGVAAVLGAIYRDQKHDYRTARQYFNFARDSGMDMRAQLAALDNLENPQRQNASSSASSINVAGVAVFALAAAAFVCIVSGCYRSSRNSSAYPGVAPANDNQMTPSQWQQRAQSYADQQRAQAEARALAEAQSRQAEEYQRSMTGGN